MAASAATEDRQRRIPNSLLISSSNGNIVNISGRTGKAVATTSRMIVSLPKGTGCMRLTTSKLFAKSARDWMSALPTSGSPSGGSPRIHF